MLLLVAAVAVVGSTPAVRSFTYGRLGARSEEFDTSLGLWARSQWLASLAALSLGLHGFALTRAIAPASDVSLIAVVAVFVLAWVAGYVVFFVPNGVGVREVVMVAGLSAQMSPASAIAIAAASRLVYLAADALAGLLAGTAYGRRSLQSRNPDQEPGPTQEAETP